MESCNESKELMSHDSVFKASLEDLATARDFFESHLPDSVKDKIDLSYLVSISTNFITKLFKQRHTDILYQTKIDGRGVVE